MFTRAIEYSAMAALVAIGVAQLFQPNLANPPADPAAAFETVAKPHPMVATAVGRACRDCHSNDTKWPWYSRISPGSWLMADDVKRGRAQLNFSEWSRYGQEMSRIRLGDACEAVRKGEMPLWYYLPAHPGARLTEPEIQALCAAAAAPKTAAD